MALTLQLSLELHFKCVSVEIDVIDYEDETGMPISDFNMSENLKAALGISDASALCDKITKTQRNNGAFYKVGGKTLSRHENVNASQ